MQVRRKLFLKAVATGIAWALCACGGPGDGASTAVGVPQEEFNPGDAETPVDSPAEVPGEPPGEPTPAESNPHRVLYLTNLERRTEGLPPLKGESHLEAAAQAHAEDMAILDYFDHQSLDGRSPWDRLEEAGYVFHAAGENIAAGQSTPEDVVDGWMNSPGHRANILNPSFRELGVGYHLEEGDTFPGPYGYGCYWVQDFGAHRDTHPLVIENEAHRTADPVVSIYLYGEDWAEEMLVSEEPEFAGATWVPFAQEISWELSDGPGAKQVCVRLRQGTAETTACDTIWLE